MTKEHPLSGLTVLLVEDESMVAMLAEDVLIEAGCSVFLAMRLDDAIELARDAVLDFAVLDINLGGGNTTYRVADLLSARRIPFMFATGYTADGIEQRFADHPRVQKPYMPERLVEVASALAARFK